MPQTGSVADRRPSFPIKAIVRVGNSGGRGFIVRAADNSRYIITAAHCIDRERYPSASLFHDIKELTFPKFVGSLAKRSQRLIWGNLCVLSLIDDIAVFCAPDSQELSEQCEAFDQFTATAMMVANPPTEISPYEWHDVPGALAWVLSVDLKWLPCRVHNNGRLLARLSQLDLRICDFRIISR